jgi:hemolysin activation/secretion protein
MWIRAFAVLLAFGIAGIAMPCLAQQERFDIVRFQVEGNTLLPEATIQKLVAPMVGPQRNYGDMQKALEALERAYRDAGYSTVQVYVPEQELTSGVIRIDVTEGAIGKIIVSGNKFFDENNVRRGLPALRVGRAPNLRELSENIQLSNENPAKQVEITLGASEQEGKVDANVAVKDENPQRVYMTLDTTGTAATGVSRVGIAYQNANLFDRDQTLTLAYTSSADAPTSVKVDIFSIGYRIPLYEFGDSIDFIYGKSGVNTPSASPVLGGLLGINGKGDVLGLRVNHYFTRRGEYTDKLIFGLDYKYINARCIVAGNPSAIDPPTPPLATCVPFTSRPVSLTYNGTRQSPGSAMDYNIGVARNVPLGSRYANTSGGMTDRFSYLTPGNRPSHDEFAILRMGGSYLSALPDDYQMRFAASGQFTKDAVVASEQFGFAGSSSVRGFNERAAATDRGYFVNSELYGPDIAKKWDMPGSLRVLAFYDFGRGFNNKIADTATVSRIGIASVGAGVRYSVNKDFSLRFDLAQVIDGGPPNTKDRSDRRGHLNLMVGF